MILIPEDLSRQALTRLTTHVRSWMGRLKRNYPQLTFDILEKEIVARIKATASDGFSYCEVTGFKLNDMGNVFIIPINPNATTTVTINQLLIVHQQTIDCWFELHKILKETPSFLALDDFKSQLSLVQKTIRGKSKEKSLSPKTVNHTPLLERALITPERIINFNNRLATLEINSGPIFKPSAHVRKVSFYSDRAILRKIEMCKDRSKNKGFTSDLTFENSKHLFNVTHCQLTGLPLVKATKTQEDNPFGFSIDRINRFEGYNVSNLLIVAHEVNKIKSKLEWSNYTESVENLREILTNTKDMMLKRHAHDNLHNRQKPLPIDTIISNYLAKSENHKKFVFN